MIHRQVRQQQRVFGRVLTVPGKLESHLKFRPKDHASHYIHPEEERSSASNGTGFEGDSYVTDTTSHAVSAPSIATLSRRRISAPATRSARFGKRNVLLLDT